MLATHLWRQLFVLLFQLIILFITPSFQTLKNWIRLHQHPLYLCHSSNRHSGCYLATQAVVYDQPCRTLNNTGNQKYGSTSQHFSINPPWKCSLKSKKKRIYPLSLLCTNGQTSCILYLQQTMPILEPKYVGTYLLGIVIAISHYPRCIKIEIHAVYCALCLHPYGLGLLGNRNHPLFIAPRAATNCADYRCNFIH